MRRLFSVATIVMISSAIVLSGLGFFVAIPMSKKITKARQSIDTARANIASLKEQQKNIESVSNNFAKLSEQDTLVGDYYLTESKAVDFFNQLDDLADETKVLNFEKQLDSPSTKFDQQLIGVRLNFSASFEEAQTFVSGLSRLRPLLHVTGITYSARGVSSVVNVRVEAITPWEHT